MRMPPQWSYRNSITAFIKTITVLLFFCCFADDSGSARAQSVMPGNAAGAPINPESRLTNIPGRKTISLNGKWQTIIDQTDIGNGWLAIWKDQKPKGKSDFYEYSFEGGNLLNVPGDFNSQLNELD